MKYLDKLFSNYEDSINERRKPGRTSFDYDAQEDAERGTFGKEVQKSKRATSDAGSGISRRLKSGEKPSYRRQSLTYANKSTQTAYGRKAANAPQGQGNKPIRRGMRKLAGPVGKLPDHTEYHRIGALMAEALGLTESRAPYADLFKGITARRVDTRKAGRKSTPTSSEPQDRLPALNRDHPEHAAADKRKSKEAAKLAAKAKKEEHTVYKQIGMAIAEVRMPAQHARDAGGSAEERKANAARRAKRMGTVMRGRSVPPATASLAVDKGISMSAAKEQRRKAREKDRAEGPQGFGPDVFGAARKKIQARKEAEREARKNK